MISGNGGTKNVNMVEALNLALHQGMEADERVLVMGEDVARTGGVFRVTAGLLEKFGETRVVDTPLSESGIIGTAIGMSVYGLLPVPEIQFDAFTYPAFEQIVVHAARYAWRTGGDVPASIVIRIPYGGGVRMPELHSDSPEAFFVHTPGLKVVCPSTPLDARNMLLAAVADPDPVIFMEPKKIYRAGRAEVPEEPPFAPGNGGDDEGIVQAASKCRRALVVHEAPRTAGLGAEVSSLIHERAMLNLDAPVGRVTGFDVPFPQFANENDYLPSVSRIVAGAIKVL